MLQRTLVLGALALSLAAGPALAQDTVKIGLILPMTGPFASTGRQIDGAVKLWMQEHGTTVAGKKIEVILKDDAGTPETTRRLAQELVVNDKVQVLAGFGLTPLALATVPIATQAKVPELVMAAATSSITEKSPFVIRAGFTLPQVTTPLADWAPKNGIHKVVTLVSDYGPGIDAETAFESRFTANGGQVLAELRVPLKSPDFAPFLQRVRDAKPDAVFVFVPSGVGSIFMKQFAERGLDKSGIRLIGTGDVTDDDILNDMGDVALGVITSFHYSAAHPSAANKAYVEGFKKLNGMRPNFHSLGGYDGMRMIYTALEKTKGNTDGEALMKAMEGQSFESPRGPVTIDPQTRDPIQNVYIRKPS
jgi:branched-chain amino acid transport system substrate-binding protein